LDDEQERSPRPLLLDETGSLGGRLDLAAQCWLRQNAVAQVERIVVSRAVLVVLGNMGLGRASLSAGMRVTGSARCATALSAASFIIACSVVKRSGLTKRSTPALKAASEAAVATAVTDHWCRTKASG